MTRASWPPAEKQRKTFKREILWTSVIAIPLQRYLKDRKRKLHPIIIDLNLDCRGGRAAAGRKVRRLLRELGFRALRGTSTLQKLSEVGVDEGKSAGTEQYIFATLPTAAVRRLVELDQALAFDKTDIPEPGLSEPSTDLPISRSSTSVRVDSNSRGKMRQPPVERAIYHIWPDFEVKLLISRSISTVKADAAQRAFSALGRGVVWAVMDSGISRHKHFDLHQNLDLVAPLGHRNFVDATDPLIDPKGHGTHVAGIIAGQLETLHGPTIAAVSDFADENGQAQRSVESYPAISGMAPECKIVSLRVLDDQGRGVASNLIAAISYIQKVNGYGRRLLIHGVNMSVGYDFDPEWFACGQSPLCVEVDRLVRSGVVVVVAAGNSGYTYKQGLGDVVFAAGEALTINDPGNADLAITVGSTHRDMPHTYGVSYFSSKGPTGDGRLKPDLLAPGEKIVSCAAGERLPRPEQVSRFVTAMSRSFDSIAWYVQDSGTSMAAPHVSGVIAAFLSIRREFIGHPEEVKKIFVKSATDLKRERYFQGNGLVDLMRAIQSV